MPSRTFLVFVAASLAGCSSAAPPAPKPEAESDSASSSSQVDSAADSDAACSCSSDDAGVAVMSRSCYCGGSCEDHDASVATICGRGDFFNVVESTFSGCGLTRIEYAWGASGTTLFFDSASGAFVGGRFDDDSPGQCPGSSQPIGPSRGTGTYELPASCVQTGQWDPCATSDAVADGADGGAVTDASPDGSAGDGAAP
jgi:hypothetical protein